LAGGDRGCHDRWLNRAIAYQVSEISKTMNVGSRRSTGSLLVCDISQDTYPL